MSVSLRRGDGEGRQGVGAYRWDVGEVLGWDLEVGEAAAERLESHSGFQACQWGAEAEVGAAPEGEVAVDSWAIEGERLRVGELR